MGIFKLIAGLATIAAGAFAIASGIGAAAAPYLISAGAGLTMSGIGTIITGNGHKNGAASTQKNSIAPWEIPYGRCELPGTVVYDAVWGANNNIRDLVIVVAACQIQSIDRMMFDQQFVQMNVPSSPGYAFPPNPLEGSYSTGPSNSGPTNGGYIISTIVRANNVVTVVLGNTIPFLQAGDQVLVQDNNGGSLLRTHTLTGKVQVAEILASSGGFVSSFSYLSGGAACSITANGQCKTTWPNYGTNVYAEWSNGGGAPGVAGGTFNGMLNGTPWLGTGQLITPASPGPAGFGQGYSSSNPPTNPWTSFCSLQGKAAVFIRICGNTTLFPSGLPLISFLAHGKNDIYDPRLGAATGILNGGFAANGSGYLAGDVLTVGGGTGGQVTILAVGAGGQLYWKVTTPGGSYSIGGPYATTGGTGSGATFSVSALGGSTGAIGYTENPALCLADFASNQKWGFGYIYGTEIPLTPLTSAANACDASVTTVVGGSEPLFACNGKFSLDEQRGAIWRDMLTSCAGRYTTVGGQLVIWPGVWYGATPTAVDFMAIAAGPIMGRVTPVIRDVYNGVKGTYVSPFNKWRASDFPAYAQDAWHGYSGPAQYGGDINLGQDLGLRRWKDIDLRFTISPRQAQQTAKIELLRSRFWGTWTFITHLAGYNLIPPDVLSATCSLLGWSSKAVEVAKARLKTHTVKSGDAEVPILAVEIDVQETDSSIYQWSTTEELTPEGYVQSQWPQGEVIPSVCWPWSPGYAAPLPGDALYPKGATGLATFGVQPLYGEDGSGNGTASLQIKGTPPINATDEEIARPQISCVGNATGGSLADGTYAVGMAARNSGSGAYKNTDYQTLALVIIAGGGGAGSITVTISNGAGDDGGDIYLALANNSLPTFNDFSSTGGYVFHHNQAVSAGATSATILVFDQSTPGGPDPLFDHFGVTWMEVVHSGAWADQIVEVTPTTLTFGGNGMTTNQWAGYTLSCIGKQDNLVDVPVLNLPVASSTASSSGEFTLTIGPNSASVQIADLTTLLESLDLMVCRGHFTFTASTFSDPNVANGYYPTGDTGVVAGLVAVVMTGADAGDVQSLASVTQDGSSNYTIYNLVGSWQITPATGDVVIICKPTQAPEVPSAPITATNGTMSGVMVTVPVLNLVDQTWLFMVRTEDVNGNHGPDALTPMRDLYFYGSSGSNGPGVTLNGIQVYY